METNKQTNKSKAKTKKDKRTSIGRNEILDYFICSADAQAYIFVALNLEISVSASCKNACAIMHRAKGHFA